MKTLGVIHIPSKAFPGKTIKDLHENQLTGWFVIEDGRPSYPLTTKEKAISYARDINAIRCARLTSFQVIDEEGNSEVIAL